MCVCVYLSALELNRKMIDGFYKLFIITVRYIFTCVFICIDDDDDFAQSAFMHFIN